MSGWTGWRRKRKARNVKQTLWPVGYCQTWYSEKDLAIDFKSMSRMEQNSASRRA